MLAAMPDEMRLDKILSTAETPFLYVVIVLVFDFLAFALWRCHVLRI